MTIIFTCIIVKTVAVDPPESTTVKVPQSPETEGNSPVFFVYTFYFLSCEFLYYCQLYTYCTQP